MIIITKNEWPLIRSSVLHHGDLVGFENVHVINNSDDPVVINFLESAASRYDVSVTFTSFGLGTDLENEIATAMLSRRHLCDFFFKLDTDEFLAVHDDATNSVLVDKSTFLRSLQKLPVDGQKYEISHRAEVMAQDTCEDPALATNFHPLQIGGMSKFFFFSKSLLMIDLGTHNGRIDPALNQAHAHATDIMLLHFNNKCYDTYIRNMKEALASQGIFSLSDTPEKIKVALEPYKDRFLSSCGMINCHKMADLYRYLNDPVEHSESYKTKDPEAITITALRDKMLALSSHPEFMP